MQKLELNNYGVLEMDSMELQEIEGGIAHIVAMWAIMAAIDIGLMGIYASVRQ
jgi:lactobin A/cerein 7B family class IIb bacteriocin